MKEVLGFSAAGLLGILVGVPLTAPCVAGCSVEEAAAAEPATQTQSQPPNQNPTTTQKKSEDKMFGLFGNSGPDAKQMIKDGALVIDVRSQEEWNEGHLSMAKLLPVDQLPTRLKEVEGWTGGDKSKPIVVHCRSGARSGRAQTILKNAGFTNVVNGGGYSSLR
jgi:phage shock protein E